MKKFIVSLITVGVVGTALAQAPIYRDATASLTTILPLGQGKSNLNAVIDVRKQKDVTFQLISAGEATPVVTMGIARSIDGVNYSTSEEEIVPLGTVPSGTYTAASPWVGSVTNVDAKGAGWIKILWLTNSIAKNLTNGSSIKWMT